MHILVYLTPNDDAHRIRSALLANGWKRVAFRSGWLWDDTCRIDSNWAAVYAPAYPGIARLYAEAGIQIVDGEVAHSNLPPAPIELSELPQSDQVTVLCPGEFLRQELKNQQPAGVTIGVNEAARVHACDWQLCNDGFSDAKFLGVLGNPARATRKKLSTSVPTGTWFDLERIGIVDATWSVICALRMAAAMKPKSITLMGHDLTVGNGVDGMTGHWPSSQLASVRAETDAEIDRIVASGISVLHVMADEYKSFGPPVPPSITITSVATIEAPADIPAAPVKPVKRGKHRG